LPANYSNKALQFSFNTKSQYNEQEDNNADEENIKESQETAQIQEIAEIDSDREDEEHGQESNLNKLDCDEDNIMLNEA